MAQLEYDESLHPDIQLKADRGEEIPVEMAQAFALLQIGRSLDAISSAIYNLSEEVQGLRSIEVELKK